MDVEEEENGSGLDGDWKEKKEDAEEGFRRMFARFRDEFGDEVGDVDLHALTFPTDALQSWTIARWSTLWTQMRRTLPTDVIRAEAVEDTKSAKARRRTELVQVDWEGT